MKLLFISEFKTTEGTGKETTLPLDQRSGIYYKVATETFTTPYFQRTSTFIPVITHHADREAENAVLSVAGNNLVIKQGYRMAKEGYLMAFVNDDWTDTNELKQIYIDARKIRRVRSAGGWYTVSTYSSGQNIEIRVNGLKPQSSTNFHVIDIEMEDKTVYLRPLALSPYKVSSNSDSWSYYTVTVAIVIEAYTKY